MIFDLDLKHNDLWLRSISKCLMWGNRAQILNEIYSQQLSRTQKTRKTQLTNEIPIKPEKPINN